MATLSMGTIDAFEQWINNVDKRCQSGFVIPKSAPASMDTINVIRTDKTTGVGVFTKLFWFLMDWTIGLLLGCIIEYKTKRKVKSLLNEEELIKWKTLDGRAKTLAEARHNFGKNKFSEIFQIRTSFLNRSSPFMQKFCQNVANATALDAAYNVNGEYCLNGSGRPLFPMFGKPDFWAKLHLNCPDGYAVRARHNFEVDYIVNFFKEHGDGKILEIACGSAQPAILATKELKKIGIRVDLVLTDFNDKSFDIAQINAQEAGIIDQVSFVKAHFLRLSKMLKDQKFSLVLAVGLNDYLETKASIRLSEICLDFLEPDGSVLFSNMTETRRGARSLRKIFNWNIIFREPEEIDKIARKAGARSCETFVVDPWGIHAVAVLKGNQVDHFETGW